MKLKRILTREIIKNGLALAAGAFLTLAFAPFSLFPIALLSPALLLWLWSGSTPKQAFLRGELFGLGLFGTGVYWVFISIHTYGYASIPAATLITAGFIAMLALFPALTGYVLNRYFPQTSTYKFIFAFPVIWVFFEWIRSWLLTGFPWLFIGYSQIDSPLRGFAPLFSVYGVSLATLICAGLLVNAFIFRKKAAYSVLAIILIFIAGLCLNLISWTHADRKPMKVTLVQGNIPQDLKWISDQVTPTLERYRSLSEKHWDSQIVIWPEAAIPLILQNASEFLEEIHAKAKRHGAAFITGIPIRDDNKNAYYNAVVTAGTGTGLYLKHRLVPFGEYIPLRGLLDGTLNKVLNIPLPDSIPATSNEAPIEANGARIATFICYEIAFPEQVRFSDEKINLILTVSNDAWFGHSIAKAQHLEIGQMRALETGRPVLFVSNDGITAMINARGKIDASAPPYEPTTLTGFVQTMTGKTPWQRFAMDPLLIMMLILLGITIRKR